MNVHSGDALQALEAKVVDLENHISDLEKEIEDLRAANADLEEEIREIDDFSDEEIREEFLARQLADPLDREWRLMADYIASGDTDAALSLLAEISEGAVSPAVTKMLVTARQEAFI